jgi:methionyl-tRNA synthetase
MSKRDGTFVKAETALKHLDPAAFRYFYASKLGPRLDDLDLNKEEFVNKFNSDLVGKVVNLASRSARFVEKTGLAAKYPDDGGLFAVAAKAGDEIAEAYEQCDFAKAMRLIIELADRANPFIENNAPWTIKDNPARQQEVCTVALNLFRQIAIYLAPVLPRLAEQAGRLLHDSIGPGDWKKAQAPLVGTPVAKFEHMLKRIELKDVEAMIEDSREAAEGAASSVAAYNDTDEALKAEPLAEECTIEEFSKVDLRVARVLNAEEVPEAKKLLKLTLSLGGEVRKTVFAGIKQAYEPQELVGRLVVVVANLKPRQMKFGLSEGMVCASGPGGEDVFLLAVDEGAVPGQRVH